ncbi:MAG TPA: ribonucleotide reductase subunit alpha [Aquabacterium sp.]|nr:ribonucleotide reductase subunit alpha [Aquabacterium sp.]
MNISSFDDLLQAAREQPDAQRLLMVFVGASLPEQASETAQARFQQGHGGELTPLMCVDKTPDEISSFEELCQEAAQFGPPWALVFVAALGGEGDTPPPSEEAGRYLESMVQAIKDGHIERFIPFNPEGHAVSLRRMSA